MEASKQAARQINNTRLVVGAIVFITGFLSPLFIPLVMKSDLSVTLKTTLSGLLLAGIPELFILITIGILGKEGYQFLKGKVMAFLKKHGPPQKVSRSRYKAGLVMFTIPFFSGMAVPLYGASFQSTGINYHLRQCRGRCTFSGQPVWFGRRILGKDQGPLLLFHHGAENSN